LAEPGYGEFPEPGASPAGWGALDAGTADPFAVSSNGEGTDHGVDGNGQLEAGA
jgi:hypothetical protein